MTNETVEVRVYGEMADDCILLYLTPAQVIQLRALLAGVRGARVEVG